MIDGCSKTPFFWWCCSFYFWKKSIQKNDDLVSFVVLLPVFVVWPSFGFAACRKNSRIWRYWCRWSIGLGSRYYYVSLRQAGLELGSCWVWFWNLVWGGSVLRLRLRLARLHFRRLLLRRRHVFSWSRRPSDPFGAFVVVVVVVAPIETRRFRLRIRFLWLMRAGIAIAYGKS